MICAVKPLWKPVPVKVKVTVVLNSTTAVVMDEDEAAVDIT